MLLDFVAIGFKETTVHFALEILILGTIKSCVSSPSKVPYSERSLWLSISELVSNLLGRLNHGSIWLTQQKSTILDLLLYVILRNGP